MAAAGPEWSDLQPPASGAKCYPAGRSLVVVPDSATGDSYLVVYEGKKVQRVTAPDLAGAKLAARVAVDAYLARHLAEYRTAWGGEGGGL